MGRHRSRSRSRSPARRKLHDEPRDRRRDRRSPAPSGLLVRNISLTSRPEDLRGPFERFGPVKDVYLPKNYYTGEPRGFGFVKFRYPEDAAEAKSHMDRSVIGGREIRIVFAEENRKTPQEMRRVTRTSSRGSHRRRSPSYSPRRRYHSRSHSPSPARRHDSRWIVSSSSTKNTSNSSMMLEMRRRITLRSYNIINVRKDRGYGASDGRYSGHRSRSMSRSASPKVERRYRSRERRSRSLSRSVSPQDEEMHRPSVRSPSPRENGRGGYGSRSQSPRRNSMSPVGRR